MDNNTNTPPALTLTDLQNLRAIIDLASRRGAFGATELSMVGSAFDKLNEFLTSVVPADTTETQSQGE
jgi:hypothetical protein